MKLFIFIILACFFYSCSTYIIKNEKKSKNIEPRKFNQRTWIGPSEIHFQIDKLMKLKRNMTTVVTPRRTRFNVLLNALHMKMKIAMRLGMWFTGQAGGNNPYWEENSINFLNYCNAYNFSAYLCAINRNLTFVEFYNYLNEKRKKNLHTNMSVDFGFQDPRHDKDLVILLTYNLTSKYGYVVEEKWRLNLTLVEPGKYRIYRMEQHNGCVDYGKAQNVTTVVASVDTIGPRMIAWDFYDTLTSYEKTLSDWTLLMDHTESFRGSVCAKEENYTAESFLIYMFWFTFRWTFDDKTIDGEKANHKLISSTLDTYVFEYPLTTTMNISESETITKNWKIRAQIKLNEHGDNAWKINRVDLTCPIDNGLKSTLLLNYAKQVVYDIKRGLIILIKTQREWHDWSHFLLKYQPLDQSVKMEVEMCDLPSDSIFEYVIWKRYVDWNTKDATLKVDDIKWEDIDYNDKDFSFEMNVKTSAVREDNKMRTIDWKFVFRLYPKNSVFHIQTLTVGCPIDS